VAWDWTVLGVGFVVLVVSLGAIATAMAYRQAPQRLEKRRARTDRTQSGSAVVAASWGLPAPAVEGVRFALDPGAPARDLAVLKTLGFTRRQLAATVAWQSSVSVVIGVVVGVPLGIITGRLLWSIFATGINAVPAPTVPVWSIVSISVGALVLANLVAAVPGRIAAGTPTALVLRAD
jgi:hypothetical protein